MKYLIFFIIICIPLSQCTTYEQRVRQAEIKKEIRHNNCETDYYTQKNLFEKNNLLAKRKWDNYSFFERLSADSCPTPEFTPDYSSSEICKGYFTNLNVWCEPKGYSEIDPDTGKISFYRTSANWNEDRCYWECNRIGEPDIDGNYETPEVIYPESIPPSSNTDCTFGEDFMGNTTVNCRTR